MSDSASSSQGPFLHRHRRGPFVLRAWLATLGAAPLLATAQPAPLPPLESNSSYVVDVRSGGFAVPGCEDPGLPPGAPAAVDCRIGSGLRLQGMAASPGGVLQATMAAGNDGRSLFVARGESVARWSDTLVLTGGVRPATVRFGFALQGELRASADSHQIRGQGFADVAFYASAQPSVTQGDAVRRAELGSSMLQTGTGAQLRWVDQATTLELPLPPLWAGTEIAFRHELVVRAAAVCFELAFPGLPCSVSAGADFGHTAGLTGLQFLDANGADITADVGHRWLHGLQAMAPVPEPSGLLLSLVGLAAMAARAALARRRRIVGLGLVLLAPVAALAQVQPPGAGALAVVIAGGQRVTGSIANAGDRVDTGVVGESGRHEVAPGTSSWWDNAMFARVQRGSLHAYAMGSAGAIALETPVDWQNGGTFAFSEARLMDRFVSPVAGHATVDIALTGGLGSTGAAGPDYLYLSEGRAEAALSFRLGAMRDAVSMYHWEWLSFWRTDEGYFTRFLTDSNFDVPAGSGAEALAAGRGVAGGTVFGVRLRFEVQAGLNPFELGLWAGADCRVHLIGLGNVTCAAVSNLGHSLHAGNLQLFDLAGQPVTGPLLTASGYDWGLPISAVPYPPTALLAALGLALLAAVRRPTLAPAGAASRRARRSRSACR